MLLASVAPAALLASPVAYAQSALAGDVQSPTSPASSPSAPPQTAAPSSTGPRATNGDIEDIVVSASRSDTSLRKTPAAVSTYSGDRLAEANVRTLVDLVPSSPNIQIGSVQNNANITVRGIGNTLVTAGSDPGVAFHQDGVYLASTGLATSAFLDVSRVEILRGPQGTLFGRNATGGAINLITNAPTNVLSYGVDATLGFDPVEDHVAGFVSGPMNADGTLLGRISLQQTYNDGFTKNLSPTGPRRLDDANNYSGRAQLQWLPSADFNARLIVEYQRSNNAGPAFYLLGSADPSRVLPASFKLGADDLDARETYATVGSNRFTGFGATLLTDWSFGGGSLKGTFAYNKTNVATHIGDGTPIDFTPNSTTGKDAQEFGELIYSSNPQNAFTYILGANYFHSIQNVDTNIVIFGLPFLLNTGGRINTNSYAGFVHGQYAFDFGLKAFGGVRYSSDEKSVSEYSVLAGSLAQRKRWSQPTYELGLSYDLGPSVSAYAKYATGYKTGGFSTGSLIPPFNPEKNTLMEAGLKGSYFNGALQANLAVFHMNYKDLQVNQIVGFTAQILNAARANITGVELETVERLSHSLRLELSGGYLDARFDRFTSVDSARPALGPLNLEGNTLPFAPRVTAHAGIFYDIPIGTSGKLTPSAQFDWKSRVYFSEFNIPIASQAPAGRLNLMLNYESEDHKWSVGAYARNVTNQTIKSSVQVISAVVDSLAFARLDPGRQIGLSLHFKY